MWIWDKKKEGDDVKNNNGPNIKFNGSRYKQYGVTPHFSSLIVDFRIYRKKYWEKINIDIINWEKLFDRSADQK